MAKRPKLNGHQVALWSGMSAFFATLLAVGAINLTNPDDQLRFLSSIFVGLITAGAVYARERLHEVRNIELQQAGRAKGTIVVTEVAGKKTFSLELDEDPEELEKQSEIVFKVVKEDSRNKHSL